MKLAVAQGDQWQCCLCETAGEEEWQLLEHLQKRHERILVSAEETKHGKVYHGQRKCPFYDWTR